MKRAVFVFCLDDAHTDFILNLIRHSESTVNRSRWRNPLINRPRLKKSSAPLPLTLNVKIAELSLNVADLAQIKPGIFYPSRWEKRSRWRLGNLELFSALIVEDKDKLFFVGAGGQKMRTNHEQEDILAGDFGLTDEVPCRKIRRRRNAGHPPGRPIFRLDDAAETYSSDLNAGSIIGGD